MSEITGKDQADATAPAKAYAPLRRSVFCALWLASLVSNIGTWIQNL
ncbi:MAG: hypothetical protein JWM11_857 [Planctomycetaceae bacterium]|nr:hypothetical protein [Planctomycetaceae bacterium]